MRSTLLTVWDRGQPFLFGILVGRLAKPLRGVEVVPSVVRWLASDPVLGREEDLVVGRQLPALLVEPRVSLFAHRFAGAPLRVRAGISQRLARECVQLPQIVQGRSELLRTEVEFLRAGAAVPTD